MMEALTRNKWLILLSLISLGLVPCVSLFLPMPGRDLGPEQPIPFSHRVHAGVKEIQCQFCHPYVSRSISPASRRWKNVFTVTSTSLSAILRFRRSTSILIPRRRRHGSKSIISRSMFSSTMSDTSKRRLMWEQCHGQVETMDRLKGTAFQMGFCIPCHQEKKGNSIVGWRVITERAKSKMGEIRGSVGRIRVLKAAWPSQPQSIRLQRGSASLPASGSWWPPSWDFWRHGTHSP